MLDYETVANSVKAQYLQDLRNGKRPNVYGLSTKEYRTVSGHVLTVEFNGKNIVVPIKEARW